VSPQPAPGCRLASK